MVPSISSLWMLKSPHMKGEQMIQNEGFYPSKQQGVVLEMFEHEWTRHAMSDKYAKDIVATSNSNIQTYSDAFMSEMAGDEIFFADWIRYNEGLLPYIKAAADTVRWLHENGYTDYKVNMQSGIIK